MTLGLIGKKCGMTRIFTKDGKSLPVTVIAVTPNRITQIKTKLNDGYCAIQVTIGERKASRITKPLAQHFAKAGVGAGEGLWEFKLDSDNNMNLTIGHELKVDNIFAVGQYIDISGITKGKGFAGVIKRHHFAGGYASHGCSLSHRSPGSIGQRQTPGRVFKGKKMAGHLGSVQRTIQSQPIVKIDCEKSLLMVKGIVPGAPGGFVIIKPSVKKRRISNGT